MGFAEQLAEHFIARQNILERYIDLCPIPCFVLDKNGETIFVNEAYQNAFDVRLDQVVGGQWERLVYPGDLPAYMAERKRLLSAESKSLSHTLRCVAGNKIIPATVRLNHVPGNGHVGYILFHCATSEGCGARDFVSNYLGINRR